MGKTVIDGGCSKKMPFSINLDVHPDGNAFIRLVVGELVQGDGNASCCRSYGRVRAVLQHLHAGTGYINGSNRNVLASGIPGIIGSHKLELAGTRSCEERSEVKLERVIGQITGTRSVDTFRPHGQTAVTVNYLKRFNGILCSMPPPLVTERTAARPLIGEPYAP